MACHDASARCAATASTEFDKILASRKPRIRPLQRNRSNGEMPPSPVSVSGKSAVISSRGRRSSIKVIVDLVSGLC